MLPLGILLIFGAGVLWLLAFDQPQFAWFSLVAGVVFLVLHIAMRPAGMTSFVQQLFHWSSAYRLNNWILIIAVTVIVVIVNIISYRHSVKTDYTQRQLYSLSTQTLSVLAGLKNEVKVTCFYPDVKGPSQDAQILAFFRRKVKDLLDDYQRYSGGKLKFDIVDPFKDPITTKKYQLSENEWGTVFFESNNRKVKVLRDKLFARTNPFMMQGLPPFKGEEAFTGALLELGSGTPLVVYFTEGHGEKQIQSDQPGAYTSIKTLMERERYTIKTLKLYQTEKIPDDCNVLVVAGPSKSFGPKEIEKIKKYLELPNKGAMFLVDITPDPAIKGLLADYGVEWTPNIVIEGADAFALFGSRAAIIALPQQHKITDELVKGRLPIALNEATYLNKLAKPTDTFEISPILESTQTAWAEFDLNSLSTGKVAYSESVDKRGPLSLGYAIEVKQKPTAPKAEEPKTEDEKDKKDEGPKTRLVVIGDSDFPTDLIRLNFPEGANSDLFLNSVAWLSFSSEKTATIRPKDDASPTVSLTNEAKVKVGRLTIIVYPLTILVLGILVWFRRSSL